MISGIYKIENLLNGHIYIGKSKDIERRWGEHKRDYKNLNKDSALYRAMRKYGPENFLFKIIEECECNNELMNELEQYWIDYYDSYKNGYNCTLGGEGSIKFFPQDIRRLWDEGLSPKQIRDKLHCGEKLLNKTLQGYSNYNIKEASRRAANTPEGKELRRKIAMASRNSKPVYQYSLTGEYLNEYSCPMEASKALGKGVTSNINNVLNGKSKKAFGYLWSYEKKDKIPPYIKNGSIAVVNKETGLFFASLGDASKWCDATKESIHNACKNGNSINTNKGLLTWKLYKENENMSRFLKNVQDIEALREAIKLCKGDVWLRKNDGTEEFNMKSQLSQFLGLARLAEEYGDQYEVFCALPSDEGNLLKYFYEREN